MPFKDTLKSIRDDATALCKDNTDIKAPRKAIEEVSKLLERIAAQRRYAQRCLKGKRAATHLRGCDDGERFIKMIAANAIDARMVRRESLELLLGLKETGPHEQPERMLRERIKKSQTHLRKTGTT